MIDSANLLAPNRDEVVSKVIDGEAILINLSNGIYYSMDKVAALVWDLIDRGVAISRIVEEVTMRYSVTPDQAAADVERLAAQLLDEKLVFQSNGTPGSDVSVEAFNGNPAAYEAPVLNIYRDMGDLLALDPPQPGLENTPWRTSEDDAANSPKA